MALAGLALVVVPFALSATDKAGAAVRLDRAGSFVFAPKIATAASATTTGVDELVDEVNAKFVPQTAARLHETPAALKAQLAKSYPAVAHGLTTWPSIRGRALMQARPERLAVLEERLSRAAGRAVQLVFASGAEASPGLLADALREGRVLVDRDAVCLEQALRPLKAAR